ncbi:MAG: PQQ-binding-like beta-propeller repeat protein [Chloroflexi bacterium]|nr:PQQ-binding-like beta-propeller repeat protein [Chloroflexota bacterium]
MLDVGYLAAPQVKPYFVEKWSTKLFEKDKTHRVAGSNSDNIKWVDMRPLLLDSGHIVVGWQHSHMASNMVCLNPGDGTIRWEQEGIAGSHGTSQLRSYGFSVFSQLSPGRIVSILRGKVEVLDAKDGEVITKWEVPIEQERCEGYWGIKVFKGIGFVIRKEGEPLVIFDENAHMLPSPGQCDSFRMCTAGEKPTIICNSHFLIWRPGKWHRIELEEQLGKSLEIWHDRLISTGEGWVRCFDLRSGKILWQRNLGDFAKPEEKVDGLYIARTQVAAKGGYLFLDCAKPSGKRDVSLVEARLVQDLMCIDMETGQTLWTVPIGHARGPDSGEVSVEEGVVIVKEMLFIQDRIFSLGLMNMYVRLKVIDLESGEVLRYLPGAFCTRAIGRFSRQNMEILGSAVLYSDIGVKEQLTVYDIKTGRRVFRHWFAMIPTTLDESGAFKAMQKAVFGDIVIDGNNWYWLGISGSVYAAQMPKDATIPLGMLRDRQADQVLSK